MVSFFSSLVSHFVYLADNTETYVMVFSKEDRILIEQLHLFKGYGTKKLATQFLEKKCQVRSVNRLKPNPITLSGSNQLA